jgi:RHS repeat-associated protein
MFRIPRFYLTAVSRTVIILVAAGLMLSPIAPALAQEAASAETSPSETSVSGAVVDRDQSAGTTEKPPITLQLPEQSRSDQDTPGGREQDGGKRGDGAPPEDGGFSTLSEEDPFPFTYERLSHASTPTLTPNESTGAFQYTLPIITPPGRNGLEPKLELVYDSSFAKNEYLGLGWSTNIPYIERINRTGAENVYTDNYFFSSLDGELRPVTSSMEEMSMGGGLMLEEFSFSETDGELAMTSSEASLEGEGSVSGVLEGKSGPERADIKSAEIVKQVSAGEYEDATYGVHVEIQELGKLDGGVQILARAWKGEEQLGFGPDGSVEIERFRIFNPPILVDDPEGNIVREWTDPETGELMQRPLREDLTEAVIKSLAHTVSIVGKTGTAITPGKVGNTTSTFYPQGGSGGGNTTFDGNYNWGTSSNGVSFSSARDQSGSSGVWSGGGTDTAANVVFLRYEGSGSNTMRFNRSIWTFDIDAVSGDTIDSATFSLYGISADNTVSGQSIGIMGATPAADNTFATTDYEKSHYSSTEFASRIAGTSWNTSAFNDFALNASGLTHLEDEIEGNSGIARLGARFSGDIDNSAPSYPGGAGEKDFLLGAYFADQTGTSNDPKLVVEHTSGNGAPTAPTSLLVEGQTNPSDVPDSTPEFSAIYNDPNVNDSATHYRIQVSTSSSFDNPYWDSGTTTMATTTRGNRSPDLSYAGPALTASTVYYWHIAFSDDDGATGAWSAATSTFSIAWHEYDPQIENGDFRKYDYVDNEWWQVTDKYGTVYKFGEATTTRQNKEGYATTTYKWMLEEVRDLNDNYISYEYYKDNGQIYPYKIRYTGHGSTDGIFEVEFARSYNPDIATTTSAGFPVKTYYKISEIHVKANEELVRNYVLSYSNGFKNINLLLTSVTESGRDEVGATTTLPEYTFNYDDGFDMAWTLDTQFGTSSIENFVATGSCAGDGIWKDAGTRPIDANGDGYADIIHRSPSDPDLKFNNTNKGWISSNWWLPLNFVDGGSLDTGARILDANGDGRPDIFQRDSTGTSTYLHLGEEWAATTTYQVPEYLTRVRFGDVNGDGLTDLVDSHDSVRRVYMNNGDDTGWQEDTGYVVPADFYFDGGMVIDVNKDGLDDLFISISTTTGTGVSKVYINKGDGTGWDYDPRYSIPVYLVDSSGDPGARLADVTNDGYPDIILSRSDDTWPSGIRRVYVNNGDGTGWSDYGSVTIPIDFASYGGEMGVRLMDVTGDGVLDLVQAVCNAGGGNHTKGIYLNDGDFSDTINYPDTLTSVTSATGEETEVKYLTTPLYKDENDALYNPNLPLVINTVRHIVRDDGFGNRATTTYSYSNGEYYFADPRNRKFAGFASTTKTDPAGTITKTYYHQGNGSLSSIGEYNDHFAKIGRPYRTEIKDSNGDLYAKTINKWENVDLGDDRNFVKLAQTVTFAYDGDSDHREIGRTYAYDDDTGNLTEKVEYGEVSGSDDGTFTDTGTDKRTTTFTYAASTTPYILGLPSRELVVNEASSTVRDTKHYYDGLSFGNVNVGNETKAEFWRADSSYASTTSSYNSYGLVTEEKDSRGNATTYTYDSFNLYIGTSTNPLSEQTEFYFDYSLGKPKRIVDANDREFETVYDGLDRPVTEKQPDLTTPSTLVTKRTFAYTDTVGSRKVIETNYLDGSTNFTLYTYLDGLDRNIQTRREAEDANVFSVRDFIYNDIGLVDQESLLYFSSGSARTSATTTGALFTTYAYDPLKRVSSAATVVGTTTHAYDDWTITATDPNGNNKKLTNDAYGRLATVVEKDGATYATTTYAWYPNDTLATTTDADGNVRRFTYDGRGLRLTAEDLHDPADGTFGTWTYTFDDAGNLTSFVDPKSQTVNFTYDALNRVLTEDYTGQAGTEIEYDYDLCAEGVSRLCIATSTSAVIAYAYNALGLQATTSATIDGESYVTGHRYDRQGNLTNVVYPDDSEVQYTYSTAGLLETVERKESGGSFADVVSDFDYGPAGQVTFKAFGNGVESTYTFDADALYRLTNILTVASSSGEGEGMGFGPEQELLLDMALQQQPLAIAILDSLLSEHAQELLEDKRPLVKAARAVPKEEEESASPEDQPPVDDDRKEQPETTEPSADAPEAAPDGNADEPRGEDPPQREPDDGTSEANPAPADAPNTAPGPHTDGTQGGEPRTEPGLDRGEKVVPEAPAPDLADEQTVLATDTTTAAEPLGSSCLNNQGLSILERIEMCPVAENEITTFKANEIAKLDPAGRYTVDGFEIDIQSIRAFDEGVEVFVKAWWPDGEAVGFGDGTVEVERIRRFMEGTGKYSHLTYFVVPDPAGSIIVTDEVWDFKQDAMVDETVRFREDPLENLRRDIGHTVSVIAKHRSERIVAGKVGNTTSTFNPDAGKPGTASVDGDIRNDPDETAYADVQSASAGTHLDPNGTTVFFIVNFKQDGNNYFIQRHVSNYDTSSIGSDAISSTTLSLYDSNTFDDTDTNATSIVANTGSSNTDYVLGDYDQFGTTKYATDLAWASHTHNAYNDFAFNATGTAAINTSGVTKVGIRVDKDISATVPTTSNFLRYNTADNADSNTHPKLIVEHSPIINVAPTAPTSLLVEGTTTASDITDSSPEFSSIYNDPNSGDSAVHYRIQVSTSSSFASVYWDSGTTSMATTTEGNRSPDISYSGPELKSATTYYWRIRFSDDDGATGAWSTATSTFSLLNTIQNISFSYDANGNIIEIDESSLTEALRTVAYTYDDLNRLHSASTTAASSSPFRHQFSYSMLGNITGFGTSTGTTTYTYAETGYANPHAVTSVGGATYTYDNNGNVTSIGSLDYTWDWRNRLASAERSGGGITTYGYDHTGQRVFKATGTATTSYPNRYYNVASSSLFATTTKHIFSPDGTLLATVEGSGVGLATTTYLHPDHLGGTNVTTDENGDVSQTLDYYPYGSQRIATGSFFEQRRFIGEEYDGDTDFSYLNARYYQGSRGQFMSQDPVFWEVGLTENGRSILSDPQQANTYGYARNNPLIHLDRTGEQSISIQGGYAIPVPGSAAPTTPIYGYTFAPNGIYRTKGIMFAVRPGPQAAVSFSPGGVSEGRVSEFSAYGGHFVGGQIGAQEIYGGGRILTGGIGVGTPGAGMSVYDIEYLMGYPELFSTIGGPLRYETTPSSLQPRSFISQPSLSNNYLWPSASKDRYIAEASGSSGSYATASSYGLQANSQITIGNVGEFISFISQFTK